MAILTGAEPFLLPGGERGVLVIHGFTGSPSEMRLLGEYLNKQGYTVMGPRLSGHGTTPTEMASTSWQNWYGTVEDSYYLLKSMCSEVSVVGLSMGGLLSLKLAAEYPVAKVVALAAPIFLQDRRISLLPVYKLFRRYESMRRKPYDAGPEYSIGYDVTPLGCLHSLMRLIKEVSSLLPAVKAPALLIQSRVEHTVRPDSATFIYRRLGSPEKKLIWLEKSGHVVTLDIERDNVSKYIADFLEGEKRHG